MHSQTVLYVTNDKSIAQQHAPVLSEAGFKLSIIPIRELLTRNEMGTLDCACCIVDQRIPHFNELDPTETDRGERTGEVLFKRVRRNNKHLPVIILLDPGQTFTRLIVDRNIHRHRKIDLMPSKLVTVLRENVGL